MLRAEAWIDARLAARRTRLGRSRPVTIDAHAGYAHPNGVRLLGRVLEESAPWNPAEEDGRLANLRGIGRLFATHEIPHARVELSYADGRKTTMADAEGYLDAVLPSAPRPSTRWTEARGQVLDDDGAAMGESVAMPVLSVGDAARFAVLSDIDDTIMQTGAENLARNLWTTFTGNPLTRRVYDHVAELMTRLAHTGGGAADGGAAGGNDGRGARVNPIFYLSSSPWNLYGMIRDVLERNDVPWGPIFLRDYGIDEAKFIAGTHGVHKVGNAERLMDEFEGLPFLLVGDLGQADAEVYAQVARGRPGRVMGVILHQPSARAHARKRRHVEEIEALGIPVIVTRDYAEAIAFAERQGWIDARQGWIDAP